MSIQIRVAGPGDAAAIADIQVRSMRSQLPYLPFLHTDAEVSDWVAGVLLPSSTVLVAQDGGDIVGFAALAHGWLEQLYLRPDRLRAGIGSALLDAIKALSPGGLDLYVFQRNDAARAFYRRHGFRPMAFGSGAANEEREPDLSMRWDGEPDPQ